MGPSAASSHATQSILHVTDSQVPCSQARRAALLSAADFIYVLAKSGLPVAAHLRLPASPPRRCPVTMAGLPVRRAPYKDFLQPALQRRFASTATVLLTVSYVEAVLLGTWDSCKQTFPSHTMTAFFANNFPSSPLVMVPPRPRGLSNSDYLYMRPRHPRPAHCALPRRPTNDRIWHPDTRC